jgi:dihydropyrimidinase
MELIIENGVIVTDRDIYKADILISNGKIISIGSGFSKEKAEVVNANGKYVMPGAVDVHTHINLQAGSCHTSDNFFTGTRAAVCGGTTTIIEHMAFGPANCSLHYQIDQYKNAIKGKAVINCGLHGVIQHVDRSILAEMEQLMAEGITSFKIYLTYDFALSDADILCVMKMAKKLNAIIAVHCENDSIIRCFQHKYIVEHRILPYYHALSRPNECEAGAIARVLRLAHMAGDAAVYIVHLSSREGLEVIREARRQGQKNIYVETCPQYLLFDETCYKSVDGLKYIMSPPLRSRQDCNSLWKGISDGNIDVVATDHCPFYLATDKQLGKEDFTKCPNGVPGIEERVMAMFSEGVMKKRITLNTFVRLLCTEPARIYGLCPRKGKILPGSDADLMIIDAQQESRITIDQLHGSVDYTLYENMTLQGKLDAVIRCGEIVYEGGKFLAKLGTGRFIERGII